MKADNFPDFSKKCLSIRLIDSSHSHDLCFPRFETQAGKIFLIGTIPKGSSESNWDANKIGAIL